MPTDHSGNPPQQNSKGPACQVPSLAERLQVAYEIGADIAVIRELPELVEMVVRRIQKDLYYKETMILSREGDFLKFLGAAGPRRDGIVTYRCVAKGGTFKIGDYVTGWRHCMASQCWYPIF